MNILITGATSGIGYQLAIDYVEQLHNVIVMGRNKSILAELARKGCNAIEIDISNYEDCQKKFNEISQQVPCLDIVILNAGICEYIDTKNFTASIFKKTYDINIMGLVNCIEFTLPLIRKSQIRHLVGTASLSQYLPFYRASAYGSSKIAIDYILNSLAVDLSPEKIHVSVINPGFVKTPMTNKNDFNMPFIINVTDASIAIRKGIANKSIDIHFPKKLSYLLKFFNILPNIIKRKISLILSKH
jgi:short-subunit dehydrogenase